MSILKLVDEAAFDVRSRKAPALIGVIVVLVAGVALFRYAPPSATTPVVRAAVVPVTTPTEPTLTETLTFVKDSLIVYGSGRTGVIKLDDFSSCSLRWHDRLETSAISLAHVTRVSVLQVKPQYEVSVSLWIGAGDGAVMYFGPGDHEVADRVAKALEHAVKLCAAQPF